MTTTTNTQIAIIFGFVAAYIIAATLYGILWRLYNKREEKKEAERKRSLIERGFGAGEVEGEKGKSREGYGNGHWSGMEGGGAAGTISPTAESG